MEKSISEILDGKEPPAEVAEVAPEATPVVEEAKPETVERPRDEHGRFLPKSDKPFEDAQPPEESAPPAPQEEPSTIPIAALKDERSKRQTAELERDELRQQLARFQQQPQAQPAEEQAPPDRWDDPEGYDQWLIRQASNAAEARAIQAFNYQRIQTDAAQFRADKPDYDEVIAQFGTMVQSNPGLIEQMQSAASPAKFAYDTAKLQKEIEAHGGIDGLVEARMKLREAEALEGLQSQLPKSVPPTISSDRSVASRSGPAWSGPQPLGDILKQ